jgi:predicted nucleic acid-binding protein
MGKSALFDANIIAYAYEQSDPVRQGAAIRILEGLEGQNAFLSVKTLSELFVTLRKPRFAMTVAQIVREIETYSKTWPVLDLTLPIVLEAAKAVERYSLSYWDAQIWATAKHYQISAVFTEDMNVGSQLEGVQIINPLDPSFDLHSWLL